MTRPNPKLFSLLFLLLFVLVLLDVSFEGKLVWLDEVIYQASLTWHTPWLDRIMCAISWCGIPSNLFILVLFGAFALLYKRAWSNLFFVILSFSGSAILFWKIKELVARERPIAYSSEFAQQGYSFPSGHATMSITFSLALFLLLSPVLEKRDKSALLAFCVIFPLLVSFSRIYLGVHYLSDVLGGMLLGLFWVMTLSWLLKITPITKP
jgi:undecaprenyl-diphosphatase